MTQNGVNSDQDDSDQPRQNKELKGANSVTWTRNCNLHLQIVLQAGLHGKKNLKTPLTSFTTYTKIMRRVSTDVLKANARLRCSQAPRGAFGRDTCGEESRRWKEMMSADESYLCCECEM